MKAFKSYNRAKKAANGQPVLRVGDLFIVGATRENSAVEEICLINVNGAITGSVTFRHLDRLGNANHAEAKRTYAERSF